MYTLTCTQEYTHMHIHTLMLIGAYTHIQYNVKSLLIVCIHKMIMILEALLFLSLIIE